MNGSESHDVADIQQQVGSDETGDNGGETEKAVRLIVAMNDVVSAHTRLKVMSDC